MGECVRCYAPAEGLKLCTTCTVALRIELADVAGIIPDSHGKGHNLPSLPEDLTITLTGQDHLVDTEPITGNGEIPLIFKQHAGEAVWVLNQVLRVWTATMGHFDPDAGPRASALWLFNNLDLVREHPEAAELVDEVTDAVHQARRAIDRPNDQRVYLGRCGMRIRTEHGPSRECREELYGYDWQTHARCNTCGTEYRIDDRQRWLQDRAWHYQGTVSEVAGFLRITGVACTAEQVRGYARSRDGRPPRLEPSGVNERGHHTYLISNVITAIAERYVRHTR